MGIKPCILLTGASGFIGSHIAENLVNSGFNVIALKRRVSNISNCKPFATEISWVDSDNFEELSEKLTFYRPVTLVHAAWGGVKAEQRENWIEQERNLGFLVSLLFLAKKIGIKKIVALGSQAEYGSFEGAVDEEYFCIPVTAYGATKLCASTLLKSFAEQNKMEWYWLRLFSVFGPREGSSWLIPSVITSLLNKTEIKLTKCEQKYDYLYIKDIVSAVSRVIRNVEDKSGIYNLSSGNSIRLVEILKFIEDIIAPERKLLNFGSLEYRSGQIMEMRGISSKFSDHFDFKPDYNIFKGLKETIDYYIESRNG